MLFEQDDKLVMIGDSITDCGRQRPVGEGPYEALGNGYVSLIAAILGNTHPELRLRIVNMGVGGNTVRDLKARWDTDVLELQPDWVSIMVGINDVWRRFDMPHMKEAHVAIEEYEATLGELVHATQGKVKGLVLLSPYYMEPNMNDPMRKMMDDYRQVVAKIASFYQCVYVDTQAAIDGLLKHQYPAALGWDRVHPNGIGHMALANAFLAEAGRQ